MLIAAAIAATADIINSLVREGRMTEARDYIRKMPIPEADKLAYETVLMTEPEKLPEILQKDTRLAQITEDPRLRDAQTQALQQLQQVGQEGYTVQDKAAIDQAMQQALMAQRGANLAQDSEMARRGISGSGIDLARQMARQQGAVQAASQTGLQQAALGRQRALQAMQAAGQLGGQIRGQEWGQKAQTASAQDAIEAANVANRQRTGMFNIQQKQAQEQFNVAQQTAQRQAEADAYAKQIEAERERDKALASTYMG